MNDIDRVRLLTLRAALKLELLGMKRRGRSALAITKEITLDRSNDRNKQITLLTEMIDGHAPKCC